MWNWLLLWGELRSYISDYIQKTDKAHYLNWKLVEASSTRRITSRHPTPHPPFLVNLVYHLVGLSSNWRTIDEQLDEGRADKWLTWAELTKNWRTPELLCRNASIVVGEIWNPTYSIFYSLTPFPINSSSSPSELSSSNSRFASFGISS